MIRSQPLQVAVYRRIIVGSSPTPHRQRHGDDQAQLFSDLLATGTSPASLWLHALSDLFAVTATAIRTSERTWRTTMSHTARLALWPMSIANILAGGLVAVFAVATDAVPVLVAVPALAIVAQGTFTILLISGPSNSARPPTGQRVSYSMFVVGETGAFVFGTMAIVAAVVSQASTGDPEFGPLGLLALVTTHGFVGLLAALIDHRATDVTTVH